MNCPKCGTELTIKGEVSGNKTAVFCGRCGPVAFVPLARAEAAEAECAAWREWINSPRIERALGAFIVEQPREDAGSTLLDRLRRAEGKSEQDDNRIQLLHVEIDRLKAEAERMKVPGKAVIRTRGGDTLLSFSVLPGTAYEYEMPPTFIPPADYAALKAENERLREQLCGAVVIKAVPGKHIAEFKAAWEEMPTTVVALPNRVPSFCPAHGRRLPCGECEPTNNPPVCEKHGYRLPCEPCGWAREAVVSLLLTAVVVGVAAVVLAWPAVRAWVEGWWRQIAP